MSEFKVGDLVTLQGHVECDVDIDRPTTCEITTHYGGGIFGVKIPGVPNETIIPAACLEWLMNEAAGRNP